MCVKPIFISTESSKHPSNCISFKRLSEDVRQILRPWRFSAMTVPCGKCIECLKDRQNDLAVRSYLCANRLGSFAFVTLTYDDEHLPFAATLAMVDRKTGDVIQDSLPKMVSRSSPMLPKIQEYFKNTKGNFKPRYFYVDSPTKCGLPFFDSDFDYYISVTPSLDRRSVRLWIKKARVNYERKYGKKLSEFKYIFVGEYGPNTCRPHVHCCFFGLNKQEVNFLVSEWKLGLNNTKFIPAVNKDGSCGYLAAAKYCAKYIAKGKFECPSVLEGKAEKPRLCSSVGVIQVDDVSLNYYRCYDVFGNFDFNRLTRDDGSFDVPSLRELHEKVKQRQRIALNGFNYKLPKGLIKKLWYEKNPITGKVEPSAVRMAFTSFVESDFISDFMQEFGTFGTYESSEDLFAAAIAVARSKQMGKYLNSEAKEKAYINGLSKSKF